MVDIISILIKLESNKKTIVGVQSSTKLDTNYTALMKDGNSELDYPHYRMHVCQCWSLLVRKRRRNSTYSCQRGRQDSLPLYHQV